MNVILYTRQGCHLCDEAEQELREQGLRPKLVDIDADASLRERYDTCVPVVVIDGKERFRGRVNRHLLARLLAGTQETEAEVTHQGRVRDANALKTDNSLSPTKEKGPMQTAGSLKGRILETLGIFAKYWEPGSVKTRLAEAIGPEAAARLQRVFLETLIARFGHSSDERAVVFDPAEREAEFAALVNSRWKLAAQGDGDLGVRMRAFAETALAEGRRRVVILGADSPTVPVAYVRQAFELLRNNPVVLGPSGDGGYYLVGVADRVPAIFEGIDWGTPAVLEQTQEALRREELSWAEVPAWYDIDELADLERLRDELTKLAGDNAYWETLQGEVAAALAVPTSD